MAIEAEIIPEESIEARERSIYDRLLSDLESEKERIRNRDNMDEKIDVDLHGEQSGLYHIRESEIHALDKMIETLRQGSDRQAVIHWLSRKIENEGESSPEADSDRNDLEFLQTLESGRDERIAA